MPRNLSSHSLKLFPSFSQLFPEAFKVFNKRVEGRLNLILVRQWSVLRLVFLKVAFFKNHLTIFMTALSPLRLSITVSSRFSFSDSERISAVNKKNLHNKPSFNWDFWDLYSIGETGGDLQFSLYSSMKWWKSPLIFFCR